MDITQKEVKQIMDNNEDVIILDCRSKEEYDEGHLKKAINIDVNGPISAFMNILTDKEKRIYVYCRSGHRAGICKEILEGLGHKNVYNFGGILTWEYEIVKEEVNQEAATKPVKKKYKRKTPRFHYSEMTGEDRDMFSERKLDSEKRKNICDTHIDGA